MPKRWAVVRTETVWKKWIDDRSYLCMTANFAKFATDTFVQYFWELIFFSFFGCTEKFVHIYGNLVWNRLVLRWYWRLIIEKLELLYVQNRIEYSKIYGNCWFLICFWYLISSRVWSMDENQSSSLSLTYSFFSYTSDSDN